MANKTHDPDYFAEKRKYISEKKVCKRYTYFCAFR